MPRHRASTQADFAASARESTRPTLDDLLILAGVNEAPNPDFDDDDPTDPTGETPRGHTLAAPPKYDGWNVAVRHLRSLVNGARAPLRDTRLTIQNASPLTFEEPSYRQDGPIVAGAEPKVSVDLAIAPLPKPVVTLEPRAAVGYAGPWVAVAFIGVVGVLGRSRERLLTNASPRATLNLSSGQSVRAYPPDSLPEDWMGLAVAMTPPCATAAAALAAPLYVQRVLDARRGLPGVYDLAGPFLADDPAPGSAPAGNQTFIGGYGEHRRPTVRYRRGGLSLAAIPQGVRFSYQVRRRGSPLWSAVQAWTQWIYVPAARPGVVLTVGLDPNSVPPGTHQWRCVMQAAVAGTEGEAAQAGELYAFEPMGVRGLKAISSADPAAYSLAERPVTVDSPETDATGVEGPSSPPDELSAILSAAPSPGDFEVRLQGTLEDSGTRETKGGPLSGLTVVTLPESAPGSGVASHVFVVAEPSPNVAVNPRYIETNLDGTDRGWESFSVPGVTYERPKPGVLIVTDRSNSAANAMTRRSAWSWDVDLSSATKVYAISQVLQMLDRVSGRADLVLEFRTAPANPASEVLLGESIIGQIASPRLAVNSTFGPAGSGAAMIAPAGTGRVRVAIRNAGSGAEGVRNFRLWTGPIHVVAGQAAPVISETEVEAGKSANPQGYCKRLSQVDSDLVLPAELKNRGIRVIEYYGPSGTPPSPAYGTTGLKIAVAPGVSYALSIYRRHQGVTRSTRPLTCQVKDRTGRILATLSPIGPAMIGSADWTRHAITHVAPANAAYLEFVGGGLSDGLVRFAALQHEESAVGATPYDNTNPASGSVAVILDSQIDGAGEPHQKMPVAVENPVLRWIRAGSIHTNTANTAVEILFASGDTPALADGAPLVADLNSVSRKRYLKVRDALSTTDLTESPEVDELYLDTERRDPVFLREDGSEFTGGVKAGNLPPPERDPGTLDEEMVSGAVRTREMRPERRWLRGLELLCYRKSAREEVSSYAKRAGRGRVEGDGMAYTVEIPGEISWEYDRDAWMPMKNPDGTLDPDGWYIFRATVDAQVIEEGAL